MKRFLVLCVLSAIAISSDAVALPRYSLMTGLNCASCHVSPNGGGLRTEGGWNMSKMYGLIRPEKTFLAPLYKAESNTLFNEDFSWGFDIRNQIAKRRRVRDGKLEFYRSSFNMQIAPYVTYRPIEGVAIGGNFNIVEPLYPEQQHFLASVAYSPAEMLTVQGGFLLPDFGVQHDDHTVFTRDKIRMRRQYQELGADVHFTPIEWMKASVGIFRSENRHDAVNAVAEKRMMTALKLQVQPVSYDWDINFLFGGSALLQAGQDAFSAYAGFGWIDRANLLAEYVTTKTQATFGTFEPKQEVFSIFAAVDILNGLTWTARYEESKLETAADRHEIDKQWVVGFEVFVLPFVELRPEYRWLDTPHYRLAQYTLQTHIFY